MNFIFLKYFYDTARLQKVSAAATENYVSQSAVSQGIAQLEKMLGVSLITHTRKRFKLTPEGEVLYARSKELLRHVDNIKLSLKEESDTPKGSLHFALSHSLASIILTPLLAMLKEKAPLVTPTVLFGHTGLIKTWIDQGDVEFGLVLDNDDLTPYQSQMLYQGNFHFYQSRSLSKSSELKACIFPPERHEIYLVKKLYKKKFGTALETKMHICSWEMCANLAQDLGYTCFLPDYLGKARSGLVKTQDDLAVPYEIRAAFRDLDILSSSAKLAINLTNDLINS